MITAASSRARSSRRRPISACGSSACTISARRPRRATWWHRSLRPCSPDRSTRCSCRIARRRRASACCSSRPRFRRAVSRSSARPTGTAIQILRRRRILNGAIYPAVDDKGYQAILPLYQQKFGGTPHPLVTIAYTAVILANASSLSNGTAAIQRGAADRARRLQRPRRRVPVPAATAAANTRW